MELFYESGVNEEIFYQRQSKHTDTYVSKASG